MKWWIGVLTLGLFAVGAPVLGTSPPKEENSDEEAVADPVAPDAVAQAQAVIYDRVSVLGAPDAVAAIPGSAHLITKEQVQRQGHADIHRVLRQVPGVYVQEEEGFGLRPNIGLRGTGVERSQKVTLLEDGVLIAPAPYAAPAAYYSPTAGRMESFEVRKGSSSIRQGPFTNGGAINYISTAIPGDLGGRVDLSGGDHGTVELHGHAGGSYENFGFLVETFQHQGDGFKDLDGGGDTGFDLEDYLAKVRFNSGAAARVYQELEIKAGRTDQDADETYLGLTRSDFARTPYRRYAGSQEDNLRTEHEQVVARYFVKPSDRLDITTTVYRNDFFRNWRKNESTLGVSNGTILADPAAHAAAVAFLRGELDSPDDAFAVRNNRRDYYAEGVQSVLALSFAPGASRHALQLGLRYHRDEEDRFQEEDLFAMRDGHTVLTTVGAPGSQANRIGEAEAYSVFVEDEITLGKWVLTPGVRYERIDFMRRDFGKADPGRTGRDLKVRRNEVAEVIPGLGVSYALRPGWRLFGGLHRGFSPPSPSSTEEVDAEESLNYELGTRWAKDALNAEIVLFFNDYDNLLGADTASGGGTGSGELFNGGAVEVRGVELSLTTDLAATASFRLPFRVAYTYTEGEFQSSFTTSFADWGPEVRAGDALPYLPAHQLFTQIGIAGSGWDVYLDANYVDETRTRAGRGAIPEAERIEDHLVFDLSGSYTFLTRFKAYARVRNLSDEVYVASRRPYGLRPGLPRSVLAGLAVTF